MGVIEWIKALFSKLLASFNEFIKEVFNQEAKLLIAEFKDFAIEVVKKLATADLTSEAKRLEAMKEIKDEAIRRGKELSDSMVNLLIELAVAWYKNNTPE